MAHIAEFKSSKLRCKFMSCAEWMQCKVLSSHLVLSVLSAIISWLTVQADLSLDPTVSLLPLFMQGPMEKDVLRISSEKEESQTADFDLFPQFVRSCHLHTAQEQEGWHHPESTGKSCTYKPRCLFLIHNHITIIPIEVYQHY